MGREPVRETYTGAGVNIDAKERAVKLIAGMAKSTMRPEVMSGVGFFGGMFDFKTDKGTVLVSSIDQVGTKTKIANAMDKHDTVGIDIVNHCVNDIFTGGAEPLFFLDYIGMAKLIPEKVESIVKGLAQACREVGCALIGGETGEMAGLYAKPDDYDLVGFVIGVVAKDKIMLGKSIRAGDAAIGLPSSGLHTNGYSLVRKIFGETRDKLDVHYPELGRTLGEELLEPHRCYYNQLKPHLPLIKGLAHITGGGLIENVPRVLPEGLTAVFDGKKWTVPPIFRLIQRKGNVDEQEMYRVYNMGIGMVVICSPENTSGLLKSLPGAMIIGEIAEQGDKERAVVQ
jgi:phosphoribosylformylglycinamidine cyclo-ligase